MPAGIRVRRVHGHHILVTGELADGEAAYGTPQGQGIGPRRHRQDDVDRLAARRAFGDRYAAGLPAVAQPGKILLAQVLLALMVFQCQLAVPGNVVQVRADVAHALAATADAHHHLRRAAHDVQQRSRTAPPRAAFTGRTGRVTTRRVRRTLKASSQRQRRIHLFTVHVVLHRCRFADSNAATLSTWLLS
ncbi:conserved hypothetical protein [Ricinus communis]|uniref:Uncharacterized protein n=1 Tax=Ricinus communis TaxID=3988 RepID=B9TP29_RICCO|nr:conserved hypothetical protein [Ricinus communis]